MDYTKPRKYMYYSDSKITELEQELPVTPVGAPESRPVLRTMQAIWQYLDENLHIVGGFDEPREYFYGRLEFYYDFFDCVNPPVFFLVGATDRTIVALGGSKKHARGFRDQEIRAAQNVPNIFLESDVAMLIRLAEQAESASISRRIPAAEPTDDWRAVHLVGMYSNMRGYSAKKGVFEVLAATENLFPVSPPHVKSPMHVLFGALIFVALG